MAQDDIHFRLLSGEFSRSVYMQNNSMVITVPQDVEVDAGDDVFVVPSNSDELPSDLEEHLGTKVGEIYRYPDFSTDGGQTSETKDE